MQKLKLSHIQFGCQINPNEIDSFRSKFTKKIIQRAPLLFQNYLNGQQDNQAYPLIQYKQVMASPAILCLHRGVDEFHQFFEDDDWNTSLGPQEQELGIKFKFADEFELRVMESHFSYKIQNWIALDKEKNREYLSKSLSVERIALLERALTDNLSAFAQGISWKPERAIEVKITDLGLVNIMGMKQQKTVTFHVQFECNLQLPHYIGLGHQVDQGFGTVIHQGSLGQRKQEKSEACLVEV